MLQCHVVTRWISVTGLLLAMWSCGSGVDRPELAAVSGTVTFKGQPLEQGSIIFLSDNNRPALGKIANGQITEVTTFEPGDGAPVGPSKVIIASMENPSADMYAPSKSLLPAKYGKPEESGLSVDLKPGQNEVKFELTP